MTLKAPGDVLKRLVWPLRLTLAGLCVDADDRGELLGEAAALLEGGAKHLWCLVSANPEAP